MDLYQLHYTEKKFNLLVNLNKYKDDCQKYKKLLNII